MQELGPAQEAPTVDELIESCGPHITRVIRDECDESDSSDRFYILRQIHQSYSYFRDLQNSSPEFYQSLLNATNASGPGYQPNDEGMYDYSINCVRGYCRKLEAVLGNRMPNVIAVPNNPNDEECIRAAQSANNAALYIREKCGLQSLSLFLVFGHFNFGTMFFHLDMIEDGDKYGWDTIPQSEMQDVPMGNAAFSCPACAAPIPADGDNPVPPEMCPQCQQNGVQTPISMQNYQPPQMVSQEVPLPPIQKPKKGLVISLHAADEVAVPLDCKSLEDKENCLWLRFSREKHKANLLSDKKWGKKLLKNDSADVSEDAAGDQYAEQIRSAMASPIGLVRAKRSNRWTQVDTFWDRQMYAMIPNNAEDQDGLKIREQLEENFPNGLQITSVRGKLVDFQDKKFTDYWRECKPEPTARIMVEPLSSDWLQVQDLKNNYINQRTQTMERSNMPIFCDPSRVDTDSLQNWPSLPVTFVSAQRPAGGTLGDLLFQPASPQFSEQIAPFMQEIEGSAQSNSGLLEAIWGGGDAEEPTARQAELKKNAALQQLGVQWSCICRAIESVYEKGCKLLAEFSDGVLEFSQKSQFGGFEQISIITTDLKSGKFHFEADEAIPMTWGQQRDLLMWMLDKPAPLLQMWGLDDPLNIFEFKQLLGMPGERTPKLDDRNAAMATISQLLAAKPMPGQPGPPNPDGSVGPSGPPQPSIQPKWEEDSHFCAAIGKAYLIVNSAAEQDNPDGFQNLRLWAQAHDAKDNQPAPPPLPKTTVSLSLKGPDLGDPAIQSAAQNAGLLPQGAPQVQSFPEKQAAYRQSLGLGPQPVPEVPPLAQPMPPPVAPAGVSAPLPPPGPASALPPPMNPLPELIQ